MLRSFVTDTSLAAPAFASRKSDSSHKRQEDMAEQLVTLFAATLNPDINQRKAGKKYTQPQM